MSGYVLDRHLEEANEAFPGIRAFFEDLPVNARPTTFLELMVLFLKSEKL